MCQIRETKRNYLMRHMLLSLWFTEQKHGMILRTMVIRNSC